MESSASGPERSMTDHGCGRPGISGRAASSPGSPSPKATRPSRGRSLASDRRRERCRFPGGLNWLFGRVASTQAEIGVLAYQRFISADRQTVYVHERYENSDAAMAHLVKFAARFGKRYGSLVERKRFLVFGDASDGLRTLLDRYGATYCRPFGPFPYWG